VLFRRKERRIPAQPGEIRDRVDLLQQLAARNGYRSYLEIGCNRNKVFGEIGVTDKVGIDPRRGGTHRMTSDEFFRQNERTFDFAFIDGLHHADQVLRDVNNTLPILNKGGLIVLHDCSPISEEAQIVPPVTRGTPWNGDVWKAVVVLRGRPDVDLAVGEFDYGCGVLLPRANSDPLYTGYSAEELSYGELDSNRKSWLRLMTGPELLEFAGRS
jgi:hypothetical protein